MVTSWYHQALLDSAFIINLLYTYIVADGIPGPCAWLGKNVIFNVILKTGSECAVARDEGDPVNFVKLICSALACI